MSILGQAILVEPICFMEKSPCLDWIIISWLKILLQPAFPLIPFSDQNLYTALHLSEDYP